MEVVHAGRMAATVHRDIKSKNILVKLNGQCAIGDFGLAMTIVDGIAPEIEAERPVTREEDGGGGGGGGCGLEDGPGEGGMGMLC